MVMKICKVCGKEFDARGKAVTCSPECSKINRSNYQKKFYKNNREWWKEYQQSDKCKEYQKKYWQSDRGKAVQKKYKQSDKGKSTRRRYEQSDKSKKSRKEYQQSDKGKINHKKRQKRYVQKKIAELNQQFDGDLELILENCPNIWMIREAIMQVEYGVSYADAMYKKMEDSPVCEVTGATDNLVIHHLNSFNTHPELGADPNNMVRITDDIHKEFHSIYGYGNNTREQWFEFLEKKHNIYI